MTPPSSKSVAIPASWWKAWLQRSRSFSLERLTGPGIKKLAPKPGPIPPPPPPLPQSSSSSVTGDSTNISESVYVIPYSVYCTLAEWHGTTNPCVPFVTTPQTPSQVLLADETSEGLKDGCAIESNNNSEIADAQIIVETNVETKKVVSKPKPKSGNKKKKKGGKCAKKAGCKTSIAKIESEKKTMENGKSVPDKEEEEEEEEGKDDDENDDDGNVEKIDLVCQISISSYKEEDQFILRVPVSSTLLDVRKKVYSVLVKRRKELEGNFENTVIMGKRLWDPPIMWENLEEEDYELNLPVPSSGERSANSTLEEAGVDDTFRITLAVISKKKKNEMRSQRDEEAQRRKREDEEFERRCRLGALFMPAEPYTAPSHAPHCCNFNGQQKHLHREKEESNGLIIDDNKETITENKNE